MYFAESAPVADLPPRISTDFHGSRPKNDLSVQIREIRGDSCVYFYRPSTKFTVICVSTSMTSPFRM